MKSILEELYDGNILPFGETNIHSAEYTKAISRLCEAEAILIEKFPECKDLLNQYQNAQMEVNAITLYRQFEIGFKAGMQIVLEGMKPFDN